MNQPTKSSSRQLRILKAAARVLRQRGRAATVEDIAREADYSAAALYRHFSGKEEIFTALAFEMMTRIHALFAETPPLDLPFESNLKWSLYRMAEFAEQERDMFIGAMMWLPTLMDDDFPIEMLNVFEAGIVKLMQQGIDEGVLREGDPALYATAFGGMLQGINHRWALHGPFEMKPRIDEMYELFLAGAGKH